MSFTTETAPGVCQKPSDASSGFVLNHRMLRVKDPRVSLDYTTRILGMRHQVAFVKRPEQGKMKDVAFIKDPDGYWIEIVEPARLKRLGR